MKNLRGASTRQPVSGITGFSHFAENKVLPFLVQPPNQNGNSPGNITYTKIVVSAFKKGEPRMNKKKSDCN
jgi:hypothetical protein